MSRRAPLTEAEKERLYQGKLQGETVAESAAALRCSPDCVRKWRKRLQRYGLAGLQTRGYGSPRQGALAFFSELVRQAALALKRAHRRWGPNRVRVELQGDPQFQGVPLPSRSRLAAFFKERCPECVATPKPRPAPPPRPPAVPGAQVLWGLDSQENIRLHDGSIATVCSIRDPVGAAMIASRAFATQTARHWRKLDWTEDREVVRTGAAEWHTLPEGLLTDNELGLAGGPNDPFPGLFTLWLVGLGVQHFRIRPHCPTDQPQIERNHRTLDGLAMNAGDLANLTTLQQALDRERRVYNTAFPARASDCGGRAPLAAHPELRRPQRPYCREAELALFDLQRVYEYLATFTFERKVSSVGAVSLGRHMYSVGRCWANRTVTVQMDPRQREWVVCILAADPEQPPQEIARRAPRNLDVKTLTGLEPQQEALPEPLQLSFACFVPAKKGTT
jgi:transposase-like protein